jgi:hypothetical protein
MERKSNDMRKLFPTERKTLSQIPKSFYYSPPSKEKSLSSHHLEIFFIHQSEEEINSETFLIKSKKKSFFW